MFLRYTVLQLFCSYSLCYCDGISPLHYYYYYYYYYYCSSARPLERLILLWKFIEMPFIEFEVAGSYFFIIFLMFCFCPIVSALVPTSDSAHARMHVSAKSKWLMLFN